MGELTMTTATEHAGDFFMRLCLSEDGLGYPDRVGVVATDLGDVPRHVWDGIDDGVAMVVVDARGGETLITPPSRFERLLSRLRRRSCVGVEIRNGSAAVASRRLVDRTTLERELLS